MKILVTPLSDRIQNILGEVKIYNNFYYSCKKYAGTVVALKRYDNWLEGEVAWVSKSEIPFVTAIRLSQITDDPEDGGGYNPSPIIHKYGIASKPHGLNSVDRLPDYDKFPNREECIKLIQKLKLPFKERGSNLHGRKLDIQHARDIYRQFDYNNDLLIRAGTCLHKAHLLKDVSHAFAEEVYVNSFIALEAILEFLKKKYNLPRKEVVKKLSNIPNNQNFVEYEEEMRDEIRNSIIHPWRDKYKESVLQPIPSYEFISHDLQHIDWLFRLIILNKVNF